MIIKQIPLQILDIKKFEGISKKTGEPYLFYRGTFLDEDKQPLKLNFNPDNLDTEGEEKLLLGKTKNIKATVSLRQSDSGLMRATIKQLDY